MSTKPRPKRDEDAPQLRLFTPATPDGLSPEMTLSEFYRRFIRRQLEAKRAAKRNLAEYDTSIKYWKELTGDPSLSAIDDVVGASFLIALQNLRGKKKPDKIRRSTIRKHCRHLQYCLDRAGPRSRECRQGQNLIACVPYLERPKAPRNQVTKNFTLDEIASLLVACAGMLWPATLAVPASLWWRSLITLAYNTGLRIGTLLELRFSWIRRDAHGLWVDVPAVATKTDEARSYYLNTWAAAAIEQMRPAQAAEDDRVYAWSYGTSWLHGVRRRLFKQAGLPLARADGNGFHGLRKAFVTELSKINAAAAKMAAGHTHDITIDYYTAIEVMVEAMNKLPQPPLREAA